MRDPHSSPTPAMLLALLVLLCAATSAAGQVAKLENVGDALVLHPVIEAAGFTLIVSGPCGFRSEQKVKQGEVVFRLGEEAIDGSYSYELVATPSVDPRVRRLLEKDRHDANGRAAQQLCRDGKLPASGATQSGGFTVLKGKIVLDTRPESERRGDRDEG